MRFERLLVIAAVGAALAVTAVSSPAAPQEEVAPSAFADCADCHEDQVTALERGPHRLLDDPAWATAERGCAACHGDGAAHLDEGGGEGNIFAFGDDELAAAKVDACQSCHADAHPRFALSGHGLAGLACGDCHSIHAADGDQPALLAAALPGAPGGLAGERVSTVCAQCHEDVFASFELGERHRLQEGILDCSSCHNPHEPPDRWRLGGFKQQACADCHTDKSGPFVFEHGSVRAEGCTSCHTPHGSPNRHMLTFQSVAELCYSCHVAVPGFHSRFTLETNCTNCHSSIHGSNFDHAFLQ